MSIFKSYVINYQSGMEGTFSEGFLKTCCDGICCSPFMVSAFNEECHPRGARCMVFYHRFYP